MGVGSIISITYSPVKFDTHYNYYLMRMRHVEQIYTHLKKQPLTPKQPAHFY